MAEGWADVLGGATATGLRGLIQRQAADSFTLTDQGRAVLETLLMRGGNERAMNLANVHTMMVHTMMVHTMMALFATPSAGNVVTNSSYAEGGAYHRFCSVGMLRTGAGGPRLSGS